MLTPKSTRIKLALVLGAILLVLATIIYTQIIVKKLLQKEKEIADLYAKSLEYLVTSPEIQSDYTFVFNEVLKAIDFPIILSDAEKNPLYPYNLNIKNIKLDTTLSEQKQKEFLIKLIQQFDEEREPIKIAINDTIILQYLHYGESEIVKELRWLPFIEITLAGLFILLGYIGFSYIKRTEQSNIWIGMAKETAHQLGTPLSNVMGWIEILKMNVEDNPKVLETIGEMENDLRRLEKVTERFSKIGSKPSLKEESLNEIINNVIEYFKKRLPQYRKNIELIVEAEQNVNAKVNRGLFEWVLENLIKNAIDAMEHSEGKITIILNQTNKYVIIDIKDTGKGIEPNIKRDIFRPGFSTKERGWGLGLSLSKRIVETYHKGKLSLVETKIGKGSTFRIRLLR
ncbi:MAG: Sensor histidine kinase [Ignavibacteriae bacterium]|nr:MAG: Sensor histidine kinase [Ignavibacteriota bacterium]